MFKPRWIRGTWAERRDLDSWGHTITNIKIMKGEILLQSDVPKDVPPDQAGPTPAQLTRAKAQI